ncbi:MAG: hypothetical protein LBD75_03400 [Candidatus Peribacteria bacterium]|jgi:hypothetical protein|nr:hypothetical protein [Candidatus Peribacteria bacterium]
MEHFGKHPDTVQALQDQQKKLMVIQIADSDVSIDGVEILKDAVTNYNPNLVPAISIKRMIMGEMRDVTVPITDGHFKDEYVQNPSTQRPVRIIKEVGVRSIKEILSNLKTLFDHLFIDLTTEKRPPKQ